MPDITVEVSQSDITANVTSPNITATVTSADITANVTTADVTANVEAANVTVNITGGGSPHIIQDEGVAETQRANLNFVGASVDVTDDSVNNATVVTITGGATAWGDITGTLADQTDLQSALDGKSDTGHTHPLSDLTQSGATLNQIPKWNGSAWVPADDETGGGASYTEITYADMVIAIAGSTLTPGGWYLITDAAGTDLGFLTHAVNENTIDVSGTGGYLNADFQAVGDYSGTPETFGAQRGIWRIGFEIIEISIDNLTDDFVTYSTSSGVLTDAETFTTNLGTTGTIIHDDGAGTVTVQGLSQALVAGEVITGDISTNTVTVDTYTNPVFVAGETVTGATTGATATVVSFDENVGSIFAYMTSPGVAFNGVETLDNGSGVTADQDGGALPPTIVQGDVVIWNLLHWQLTDSTLLDGTNPETNTEAYTQLTKATANVGYIETWNVSEFDFANAWLQYRQDLRGNKIRYPKSADDIGAGFGEPSIFYFQWGRDTWVANTVEDGYIDQKNFLGTFESCKLIGAQAAIYGNTSNENGFISNLFMDNGGIFDNQINGAGINGMYIYGGNIYENILSSDVQISSCFVYYGADITGLDMSIGGSVFGLYLSAASKVQNIQFSLNSQLRYQNLYVSAIISNLVLGQFTIIENNILENGAQMTGITTGANCSISRNKIGQEATLGGSTTMGDGAAFNDLDIRANKQIANKTLDAGVAFSDKIVQLTTDATETYSANVTGNRTQPGYSDIPGTIDITGLTTLDCTAAWAQYRGIFNLTSSNATEAIDTITNPPTAFPFTIRPAAGLTLTVTGTAYAGIAAGQIALKNASYVLDGTKGEYIVLEIDPLGTGCLVEKQVVNGII